MVIMKTSRNPDTIHNPVGPYVHQIEVTGPQRWLNLSGQLGMSLDGTVPENPLEQLKLALENVKKNLDAAEMEIEDLTKMVLYLVGNIESEQRRKIVRDFLGEHLPCTTVIYVVALAA